MTTYLTPDNVKIGLKIKYIFADCPHKSRIGKSAIVKSFNNRNLDVKWIDYAGSELHYLYKTWEDEIPIWEIIEDKIFLTKENIKLGLKIRSTSNCKLALVSKLPVDSSEIFEVSWLPENGLIPVLPPNWFFVKGGKDPTFEIVQDEPDLNSHINYTSDIIKKALKSKPIDWLPSYFPTYDDLKQEINAINSVPYGLSSYKEAFYHKMKTAKLPSPKSVDGKILEAKIESIIDSTNREKNILSIANAVVGLKVRMIYANEYTGKTGTITAIDYNIIAVKWHDGSPNMRWYISFDNKPYFEIATDLILLDKRKICKNCLRSNIESSASCWWCGE